VSTLPATPPIAPGVSGAPGQVNVILKEYLFAAAIVDLVRRDTGRSRARPGWYPPLCARSPTPVATRPA
jgi:hypothetical protein